VTPLHRAFLAASDQLLLSDLLRIPPAHTKLCCQLPQATCARFIGFQQLAPQIIRIGLRHLLLYPEIIIPTLPLLHRSGYSKFSFAYSQRLRVLPLIMPGSMARRLLERKRKEPGAAAADIDRSNI